MTNANQPHGSQGPTAGSRLRAFLLRRTIVRDVVQGIIAGGVLALFTAILIINAEETVLLHRHRSLPQSSSGGSPDRSA